MSILEHHDSALKKRFKKIEENPNWTEVSIYIALIYNWYPKNFEASSSGRIKE